MLVYIAHSNISMSYESATEVWIASENSSMYEITPSTSMYTTVQVHVYQYTNTFKKHINLQTCAQYGWVNLIAVIPYQNTRTHLILLTPNHTLTLYVHISYVYIASLIVYISCVHTASHISVYPVYILSYNVCISSSDKVFSGCTFLISSVGERARKAATLPRAFTSIGRARSARMPGRCLSWDRRGKPRAKSRGLHNIATHYKVCISQCRIR